MIARIVIALVLLASVGTARAEELKMLAAGSLKAAMTQLAADYQKATSIKVDVDYGPAGAIAQQVEKGAAADLVVVGKPQLKSLDAEGKLVKGSMADIAGVEIGLAVREGAPKPDISTVEKFKETLRRAKSFGYVDPALGSSSGKYAAGLMKLLGLADTLKSKIVLTRSNDNVEDVFRSVANGTLEMQIGQITEIVLCPGVALVGPIPKDIQNVTLLSAGVTTSSKQPEAAAKLVKFMSSPDAIAILKAKGFTPE